VETRSSFHAELDEITREIVLLAAHVTEAIPAVTEALLADDVEAAQRVIDHDDVLDELALDIEERCYRTLARQQPVASDLRALIAATRMVAEIERSGDLVVNIAKVHCAMRSAALSPEIRGIVERMGEEAARLFRMCIDAYAEGDVELAAGLERVDDVLDQLHAEHLEAVVRWGEGGSVRDAIQLALIGRYFERIGDHAVNIGERVRYLIEGSLPSHPPHAGSR
jgi:phosphate transport system protein